LKKKKTNNDFTLPSFELYEEQRVVVEEMSGEYCLKAIYAFFGDDPDTAEKIMDEQLSAKPFERSFCQMAMKKLQGEQKHHKRKLQSIKLYRDWAPYVKRMDDSEIALKTIYEYVCDGSRATIDDDFKQAFLESSFEKIDGERERYLKRQEVNRQNAMQRWHSDDESDSIRNDADKCETIRKNTNPPIDSDSLSSIDSGSDSGAKATPVATPVVESESEAQEKSDFSDASGGRGDAGSDRGGALKAAHRPAAAAEWDRETIHNTIIKHHIDINSDGLTEFLAEVRDNDGYLWGRPITNRIRALRAWAKKHPEFSRHEDSQKAQRAHKSDEPIEKHRAAKSPRKSHKKNHKSTYQKKRRKNERRERHARRKPH
jgi:hypothetical protein